MVATAVGTFLILLPFICAVLLLTIGKWKADTTGFAMWIFMLILAMTYFKTKPEVTFLASIAGFINSYPITLMVCTSIFMITYMQQTGALQRIIVAFKTLGGVGKEPFQIMFINIAVPPAVTPPTIPKIIESFLKTNFFPPAM